MVGLMLKDLLTMRRYLKSLLGVCVLLGATGFILKSPSYVSGVGGVTSFLVCMVSFSYDENCKWDAYGLTLPVTRKTCVQAKYLLSLAMVVLGAVVSALIAGGIMAYWETIDWMELLSLVGSTTVTGIVIISLMIPCIYKLGVERSRLAIMVVFLVPMGVFLWYLGSGLALPTLAPWIGKLLPVLLALLLLLLLWGSYLVSRRIYGKKEF